MTERYRYRVVEPGPTDRLDFAAFKLDIAIAAFARGVGMPARVELLDPAPFGPYDFESSCRVAGMHVAARSAVQISREWLADAQARRHIAAHEIAHHGTWLRGESWSPAEEEERAEGFARGLCRRDGRRCVLCERPLDWVVDTAAGASVAVSKGRSD